LQDKNPRPEKYKSFVLLYHSKDPSKSLLDPIKVEACSGVKVARIKTIRAAAPGLDCVALMSTTGRYRLNALCRELTTDTYNKVDKSGLQIMGSEGLTILCNDETTRDEYKVYKSMIDRVINRNNISLGKLLKDWTRKDGGNNEDSLEEFDIVKKRRLMESTPKDNPNPDDSPSELERFEEFEQAVLPALLQIHGDDQNNKAVELVQLEKELQAGAVTTGGGVYIASCAAFSTYLKIGATRRSEPTQRLYEISRYVPVPFRLIAWIPSNFPFQLEAQLHRHFDTQRLKANGAGTEFFKLDISVLMEVLSDFV
jgi:hypothetical protein